MAEAPRATVPGASLDHGVDRIEIEQIKVFGSGKSTAKLIRPQLRSQIEEGAGDGGDRDPVDDASVVVNQIAGAVPGQALRRGMVAGHHTGDVDRQR
jgi:hypothetical protein